MSITRKSIDDILKEESNKKQVLIVKKDTKDIIAIITEDSIASKDEYNIILNYDIFEDLPHGILVYDKEYLIARISNDIKEVTE